MAAFWFRLVFCETNEDCQRHASAQESNRRKRWKFAIENRTFGENLCQINMKSIFMHALWGHRAQENVKLTWYSELKNVVVKIRKYRKKLHL